MSKSQAFCPSTTPLPRTRLPDRTPGRCYPVLAARPLRTAFPAFAQHLTLRHHSARNCPRGGAGAASSRLRAGAPLAAFGGGGLRWKPRAYLSDAPSQPDAPGAARRLRARLRSRLPGLARGARRGAGGPRGRCSQKARATVLSAARSRAVRRDRTSVRVPNRPPRKPSDARGSYGTRGSKDPSRSATGIGSGAAVASINPVLMDRPKARGARRDGPGAPATWGPTNGAGTSTNTVKGSDWLGDQDAIEYM